MVWEYLTDKIEATGIFLGGKVDHEHLRARLNHFGQFGWELVSAVDTSMNNGQTRDILLILKRAKPSATSI